MKSEKNSLSYDIEGLLIDRTRAGLIDNYLSCSTDNVGCIGGSKI